MTCVSWAVSWCFKFYHQFIGLITIRLSMPSQNKSIHNTLQWINSLSQCIKASKSYHHCKNVYTKSMVISQRRETRVEQVALISFISIGLILSMVQPDNEATEVSCQLIGTLVDKLFSTSSFSSSFNNRRSLTDRLCSRLGVQFILTLCIAGATTRVNKYRFLLCIVGRNHWCAVSLTPINKSFTLL